MTTRPFPPELSRLESQVLEAVSEDALEGRPARSNSAYADTIICSPGSVIDALRRLQQRGLIAVERRNSSWQRRIALLDHGEPYARTLWSDDPAKPDVRKRPCITCGETFASEGIHNRMCQPCKNNKTPVETFAVSRGRRSIGAAA